MLNIYRRCFAVSSPVTLIVLGVQDIGRTMVRYQRVGQRDVGVADLGEIGAAVVVQLCECSRWLKAQRVDRGELAAVIIGVLEIFVSGYAVELLVFVAAVA